jgi:hypothetical protein
MISLTTNEERIKDGETIDVELNISGAINIREYKGKYFNLIIKKNGEKIYTKTLNPLRFNKNPLIWNINDYSYSSTGTYIISCVIQDTNKQIANTNFIVESDLLCNKSNNLSSLEQILKLKEVQIKKQEIPIDYTSGCNIEKIQK